MFKKAFAVLLAFVLLASVFPVNVMAADDEPQEEPQFTEIRTVEELYMVNLNLAGNYRLMNDIDLTEATAEGGDWDFGGRGWEPIGSNDTYSGDNPFTGIFDGNGCEIKGLSIRTGTSYVGLFAKNQGTIKNLNVSGNISGTSFCRYVGFIAGYNDNGSIEGCTVSGSGSGNCYYIGGITGYNTNGNIKNCINKSDITQLVHGSPLVQCAGIVGYSENGTISECVNIGNLRAWDIASGIVGNSSGSAMIRDCYNTGMITSIHLSSGISYRASAIENCYNIGTIESDGYSSAAISYFTTPKNCYYLNGTGWGYTGAKALTDTQMKLKFMYIGFDFENTWFLNPNGKYCYPQLRQNKQTDDEQITEEYSLTENNGVYEIRTVTDLYYINYDLDAKYRLMNDIDLTEATAEGGDWDYGGRGWEPIGSNGTYSGDNPFTGIFDGNGYEIKGLRISPSGTGMQYVGLFAKNQGTIKNLNISGAISGYGKYTGFIAGYNDNGSIEGCTVSGSVSGSNNTDLIYRGGIAGYNNAGTIENCFNKCDLSYNYTATFTQYSETNIERNILYAGIAGYSESGTISRCVNTGNVSVELFGEYTGKARNSKYYYYLYASGIANGSAVINDCYNTGTAKTANEGKLLYESYGYREYSYCYSAGIATEASKVLNCYNTGSISAQGYEPHNYAIAHNNIQNCYYLNGTGQDSAGAKALTEFQMRLQFMYIGFDFDNTWFIADDETYPYPQLRSNPQRHYELKGLKLEDAEIDIGESKALKLECIPNYATVQGKITWTSSNESVATVDDNGTVTAIKRGEATITATAENGISATCTVKVLVPITELSFGSESLTVPVGTKQKLGFTVLPADTTDTYEFTSSDPKTVSVNASGNITAKKVGTAEITVTSSRGLSASCTVTVNNPATSVTLSESIKKLFAGKSFTLSARVYPDGTTDALTWSSSDNEVAAVDQNGVVTAVSAGKANITATADSGASASCEVTVESDINKTTVVMEYQETQYDGTEKKPAVTVYYNGELLIEDADYSLTYENNTNAGEASVTIASLHDESEVVRKFNINPLSVRALSLLFHSEMVYTGSPLNAIEEITYQSLLLTEGTDYTLEYKDNTNAGTASVTVTGMGNFIGTMTKSFTILPKPIDETIVVLDSSVFMYDGTEKTPTVTVMDGERVLEAGADYRLTYSDNISAGNASVTVEGVDNYAGSKTVNFRIEPKSILDAKVTLHSTVLAYDGTEKRPEVRVEDNGVVLTIDVDYYLDYKNNLEAGTASVNVVGMGSYYGTIATEFEIIKIGDVNMNGQIEIQDVTVLQRHLAEFVNADGSPIIDEADEEMLKIADVNRDGIVTIFDVTTIQRYLAEMIDL